MRMDMPEAAVGVHMEVQAAAASQFVKRIDSQGDQHQRDAEFKHLCDPWRNLDLQQNDNDASRKKRDSVPDTPQTTYQRGTQKAFAFAYDRRDRGQMIGLYCVLQTQNETGSEDPDH
jgi:hypothetical protein